MTTDPYIIVRSLLQSEGIVSPDRIKAAVGWSDGLEKSPDELLMEVMDYFVKDLQIAVPVPQGWQGLNGWGRPIKPSKAALKLPKAKPLTIKRTKPRNQETPYNAEVALRILVRMDNGDPFRPACEAEGVSKDVITVWRKHNRNFDERIKRAIKVNGNSRSVASQAKFLQAIELLREGVTKREIMRRLVCGNELVIKAKRKLVEFTTGGL